MQMYRVVVGLTAAAVLILAAAAAPASAGDAGPPKFFAVDMGPDVAASGSSVAYTAQITNSISNQRLGSVNLTAPTGVVLRSASQGTVVGRTLELRDLALAPGGSITVTLQADTSTQGGTLTWAAAGKQANNFNGTGNDFLLDPTTSDLDTEVNNHSARVCHEEAVGSQTTPCTLTVTWHGFGDLNSDGTPVPNDGPAPGAAVGGAATTRAASIAAASESAVVRTSFSVTVTVTAYPSLAGNAGTLSLELPAQEINCLNNSETSPVTALIDGPVGRAKTVIHNVDAGIALAGPSQGMCFAGPVPVAGVPSAPVLYGGSPFFASTLADCFDGSPTARLRDTQPCRSFAGNEGGDNITNTEVPASYPDPAYRP